MLIMNVKNSNIIGIIGRLGNYFFRNIRQLISNSIVLLHFLLHILFMANTTEVNIY